MVASDMDQTFFIQWGKGVLLNQRMINRNKIECPSASPNLAPSMTLENGWTLMGELCIICYNTKCTVVFDYTKAEQVSA